MAETASTVHYYPHTQRIIVTEVRPRRRALLGPLGMGGIFAAIAEEI
jgi:hypothetical protein